VRSVTHRHAVLPAVLTLLLAGCSDEPTQPPPPPAAYRGVVIGTEGLGTIEVLIASPVRAQASSGSMPARGTLRLNHGHLVVPLTGSYDPSANELGLNGTQWFLTASRSGDQLVGDFTSGTTGVFIALESAGADPITAFGGEEASCNHSGSSMRVALAVRGESVVGVTFDGYLNGLFTGSFSATDSSLTLVNPFDPTGSPLGTGRVVSAFQAHVNFTAGGDTCVWVGDLRP